MVKLRYKGTVQLGIFVADDTEAWQQHTKKFEGEEVWCESLEKFKQYKARSKEQNDYWWAGIVKTMSDENGDTTSYWHDYLKVRFLLAKIIGRPPDMDKIINAGKLKEIADILTTTSLTPEEFSSLTSDVRAFASRDFGIYILTPEEYWEKISRSLTIS